MTYIKTYKELNVWKRSMELVEGVYKVTKQLPSDERYGLVSQMRRSAVSVPSNIAEGYKRKQLGDYVRFLNIADASAAELETQVLLIQRLYTEINIDTVSALLEEVQKMLAVMIRKLNAKRS